MKWFLDTEFYEVGSNGFMFITLISIGLVNSEGKTFYAENSLFDWDSPLVPKDHWIRENVRPHLIGGEAVMTPEQIRKGILEVVGPKPTFYGWYCDYDWVVLCSLFGSMVDLPNHFPRFCMDLKQMTKAMHFDAAKLPKQISTEHNALDDALWNRDVYAHLEDVRRADRIRTRYKDAS